ncbi:MAG: AAA-associated domain-containing protein [Candidatus Micrarchaeia archaeon]
MSNVSSNFPESVTLSQIEGLIKILNEKGGGIKLSELAEDLNVEIDKLLPPVYACELLGFCNIKKDKLLIKKGTDLKISKKILAERIRKIEPFKSALLILQNGPLTSIELLDALEQKGIIYSIQRHDIQKLFYNIGIRLNLLKYKKEKDEWSIYNI